MVENSKVWYQSINTDNMTSTPERGLLAAVLECAFRDLIVLGNVQYRRDAINWFYGVHKEPVFPEFTFKEIASMLSLTNTQMEGICLPASN